MNDPPPAYTPAAHHSPSNPSNSSGEIAGVGIGYGRRMSPSVPSTAPPVRPPPPLPSRPDSTPTTVPTPGRPLLHRGCILVYPKDFWCQKCRIPKASANANDKVATRATSKWIPQTPTRRCVQSSVSADHRIGKSMANPTHRL